MATPKQNYTQQFRAYAQPAATPVVIPADLPASVRTYSVFDPNSNTWRRMTNDGRSPIPTQRQAVVPVQVPAQSAVDPVVQALAIARQTQGRDWAMPLPQTPVQKPSRSSRRTSQPLSKAGAVPMQGQPSKAPQKAPEAPVAVQTVPAEGPATTVVIPEIPGDTTVRSPAELYQGMGIAPDGTIVRQTPLAAITRQGLSVPEIPSMKEIVKTNIPYAAPVDLMFTPEFDARAYDYSQGTLEGNIKRTRNTFNNFLSLLPLGSKKLNTTYSNNSMADLAKNYYNHKLHPSIYPNKYAKPEAPLTTNIGSGLGKAQYQKESTGPLLGAMRKPFKVYESPHADTQSLSSTGEVAAKPVTKSASPKTDVFALARAVTKKPSVETNIGSKFAGKTPETEQPSFSIWNNARNPERVGNWGGVRQAGRNYSQKMSENLAVGPTQKIVINPNVRIQDITKKPGGMTIWDRYADSKNYSEGFLNPYMRQTYGARVDVPFLPFAR